MFCPSPGEWLTPGIIKSSRASVPITPNSSVDDSCWMFRPSPGDSLYPDFAFELYKAYNAPPSLLHHPHHSTLAWRSSRLDPHLRSKLHIRPHPDPELHRQTPPGETHHQYAPREPPCLITIEVQGPVMITLVTQSSGRGSTATQAGKAAIRECSVQAARQRRNGGSERSVREE